jgi:cysteine synthase A
MGGDVCIAPAGDDICAHARRLAREHDGYFMDQFRRAAEVTDWRGSNNIAESLFAQMTREPHPVPDWVVVGAGTGGTSATIGRYVRRRPELADTRLCVVDPEGSAFFAAYASGDFETTGRSSRVVEGIGRGRVEASFVPGVVDHMLSINDAASVAAAHWLRERTGRLFGPSTGTNIVGALLLGQAMERRGARGSIVTLGCDRGDRYLETIYDAGWLAAHGIDTAAWRSLLDKLGEFRFPSAFGNR